MKGEAVSVEGLGAGAGPGADAGMKGVDAGAPDWISFKGTALRSAFAPGWETSSGEGVVLPRMPFAGCWGGLDPLGQLRGPAVGLPWPEVPPLEVRR